MKTDITIGSYHAVFEHPKNAYLVGVTVKHSGMDFSTIDGLSIEYDNNLWTAKITEAYHTTHISAEEIIVYLIDFLPLAKGNSIRLMCRFVQDRI